MNSSSSFRPLSYFIWKRRGRTSSGASATQRHLRPTSRFFWCFSHQSPDLGSLLQCLGFHCLPVSFRLVLPAYTRLAQSILAQKRSKIAANCSAQDRTVKGQLTPGWISRWSGVGLSVPNAYRSCVLIVHKLHQPSRRRRTKGHCAWSPSTRDPHHR